MKNQSLKFVLALVAICALPACARHGQDHDNITISQKVDTPAAAEKVAAGIHCRGLQRRTKQLCHFGLFYSIDASYFAAGDSSRGRVRLVA